MRKLFYYREKKIKNIRIKEGILGKNGEYNTLKDLIIRLLSRPFNTQFYKEELT
jgi:hypothetical protein